MSAGEDEIMAWEWNTDAPPVHAVSGCIGIKRRTGTQKRVLVRADDPITITNLDNGEKLELPVGTLSDGSSVPGALWGLLDAGPTDLLLPGFAHDYAYRMGARITRPDGSPREITRYEADLYHVAICKILDVGYGDRAKIFFALRVGGGPGWHQRTVPWDGQE
jgi:hypothetical protein